MQRKEYNLPNGKKAVFEFDGCGIGKITLECMDELMSVIADRPQGEWIVIEALLNRFIEHFGHKPQVYKAVEELLELAEVLIKDVNKEYSDKPHIVEEMADVCIMLHQVKMIYGITTEELKDIVKQKLKRTMIRISENAPEETIEDPQLSWSDYKDIDTLEINGDQIHRSRAL